VVSLAGAAMGLRLRGKRVQSMSRQGDVQGVKA
jgi:hypothetical protein